ncbi:hypothetical protein ACGFZ7_05325 [Pseudomonas sp. NPDC047963]|nr:hypothetical protein [Pseudomonas sp.]
MKKYIELIASLFAVLLFFAAVIPYLVNFGEGLSKSNEVWGQFGDYLGGSLNPVFGFLTLLVVLYNTRIQRDEIENNKHMMLEHTAMLSKQLELTEQKAIEEFTFQLLEEARTDEAVQKARAKEAETLIGIFILHMARDGQYEQLIDKYDERAELANIHFKKFVGIEFGEFSHIVYPKILALVACVNKLPSQNRIFMTNLIKSRFGMAVVAAAVQLSVANEREKEYSEFKKLSPILHGAGDYLIFSERVCKDLCDWLTPEEIRYNTTKSRAILANQFMSRQPTPD